MGLFFMKRESLRELNILRTCALLHDVGKLDCWAKQRPWSEHVFYTFELLKESLKDELAYTSMRHHEGRSYPKQYHPKSEFEKIICIADNLSSGADRREEPEKGSPLPKPPFYLTHILSKGEKVRAEVDTKKLAYTSVEIGNELKTVSKIFGEDSGKGYHQIFEFLSKSSLLSIPADTRRPVNDVSLWQHLKLTSAFATCIFFDGGFRGRNVGNYSFALLSGDGDWVSRYIATSVRLPDLSARSKRIIDATSAATLSVAENLGPECVIFGRGGGFLALCPVSLVDNLASKAKEAFEEVTEGEVTVSVSHVVKDGRGFQRNFGSVWREAMQKMRLKKLERTISIPESLEVDVNVCDVCNRRAATHFDKMLPIDAFPRPEALCDSCWKLREEGRLKRERRPELDALKDENNFVAVLKADGDDMGKVLQGEKFEEFEKNQTPSRLSAVSSLIHEICEKKLREIVEKNDGVCLFAGGDDLLAILPGDRALKAARELASSFNRKMAGQCTLSAGVVIFNYKLPIYVGLEAAQSLLSNKAKARENKNGLAFAVIGGSGLTEDSLEKVKSYDWDEVDELFKVVDFMYESGLASGQIRRIAEYSRKDVEEAEIYIKYLMGRGYVPWREGELMISHLKSGFLFDSFLVYNLFKPS